MATLQLGGLTFYGQRSSSRLYFRRLTDWYTVPDSKADPQERPQGHGAFGGGMDWRKSAVPSFEAMYVGTDRADALRMQQYITGKLASGEHQLMTVDDELGATSRLVSVRNVKVADIRNSTVVQFTVDTLAEDPRRYGPAVAASTGLPTAGGGITYPISYPLTYGATGGSGRVTVTNPGTAESYSSLEVTGGLDAGFSLVEVGTGREQRFERIIPVGSTVYLNPRTGRAYIDDPENDVSGSLTVSDWWSLAPGASSQIQFVALGGSTGTPTFTARTAPAYW